MKFLRAIRFDESDIHVFGAAAVPGEWVVSGAFAFASLEPEAFTGKTRQAFTNGLLGVPSFARTTFAAVAAIDEAELSGVVQALAAHFVAQYGAPDNASALPAARDEADFVADLCKDSLINTVFAVTRSLSETGDIHEEFRIVQPPSGPLHTRIWDVVQDDA